MYPITVADFLIAYAAHTPSCTFLLDDEGFCRKIVMTGARRESRNARRCVNAQYVASLDLREAGGLVEMPTPGAPMLFARVDENGRVALVRTGPVVRFETMREQVRVDAIDDDDNTPRMDPFTKSASVETSVPHAIIEDLARREASRRSLALVLDPPSSDSALTGDAPASDPDYSDESIRTRKMQSITPEEAVRLLALHGRPAQAPPPPARRPSAPDARRPSAPDARRPSAPDARRPSAPDARQPSSPDARRPSAPDHRRQIPEMHPSSAPRSSTSRPRAPDSHARATEPPVTTPSAQAPATLRTPPPDMGIFEEEDDYATVLRRRRGMLPPRSDVGGARRRG
jgi:hypothetical protein